MCSRINFGYSQIPYCSDHVRWFVVDKCPSARRTNRWIEHFDRKIAMSCVSVLGVTAKSYDASIPECDQGRVPASTAAARSIWIQSLKILMDMHLRCAKPRVRFPWCEGIE